MAKLPESDHTIIPDDEIPLGQRLFDNWLLLMIAGIVIMAVIYTGWGMWEIANLPTSTLP